ncbi:MAG: CoA pyrophosphatase [Proteobacteria bacterium]|nr:CoA pyrophosphatase [Pseudomonadota bacterium]
MQFDDTLRDVVTQNLATFPHTEIDVGERRQAAVALTIVESDEEPGVASMLLTRRNAKMNKHAGQWALPGGRVDEGETPLEGARREMIEEVGLALDESALLGRLDDITSRSGYLITPFVFWADDCSAMAANPDEVASIHRIPLHLFTGENAIQFIDQETTEAPLLRLQLGDNRIHAPTGAFMLQLWEVGVNGRHTRVDGFAHPEWAK